MRTQSSTRIIIGDYRLCNVSSVGSVYTSTNNQELYAVELSTEGDVELEGTPRDNQQMRLRLTGSTLYSLNEGRYSYLDQVAENYIVQICNTDDVGGKDYRYGFNGQEKDNEIKGEGNSLDYKYRMADTRLGRFFSTDPIASQYPELTPFQMSSLNPIWMIELEGLEGFKSTSQWTSAAGIPNSSSSNYTQQVPDMQTQQEQEKKRLDNIVKKIGNNAKFNTTDGALHAWQIGNWRAFGTVVPGITLLADGAENKPITTTSVLLEGFKVLPYTRAVGGSALKFFAFNFGREYTKNAVANHSLFYNVDFIDVGVNTGFSYIPGGVGFREGFKVGAKLLITSAYDGKPSRGLQVVGYGKNDKHPGSFILDLTFGATKEFIKYDANNFLPKDVLTNRILGISSPFELTIDQMKFYSKQLIPEKK
jgi:RHS repeat-associated protein